MAEKVADATNNIPSISSYRWSCDDESKSFIVDNPATGKALTTVRGGNIGTTTAAIEASQVAWEKSWRWTTRQERSGYLFKAADELQKHVQELAILLCLENGKPVKDAFLDVGFLLMVFRYFASIVDKLPSECFDQGSVISNVMYEPHGVCVGILPFNWPPVHTGGKLAPCLAAGNTMILKPGEQAPLTVMRIVEILQSVFPPDVVQAIPGAGPEVSQALIQHPLVKMVSFTGSTPVGRKVAIGAAPTMTQTALELGGKNAMVLFEDADLNTAIRDAIDGAFFNKGEACTAISLLIVHESIHNQLIKRLKPAIEKLCTGDGMSETTHIGPLVSHSRAQQVLKYIEQAQTEGATIAAQGTLPTDPSLSSGFYVAPTLLTNVTPKMTVFKEEIFGPVLSITTFTTEPEAITLANSSDYGLFGTVYSADFSRAMRVARKLDVGVCMVNNYSRAMMGSPFGGMKGSGHGREHWMGTLKEWSRVKNIRFPSGLGDIPNWRGAVDVLKNEDEVVSNGV